MIAFSYPKVKINLRRVLPSPSRATGLAKNYKYDNIRRMSKTVIEVKKNPNENNTSILRRFSRKMIESGITQKVKKNRYNERPESKLKAKKSKLKRLTRRAEVEKLRKLGKMK